MPVLILLQLLLPKEPGVSREAVSWFSKVYPRTKAPEWQHARPMDIIQVSSVLRMCGLICACLDSWMAARTPH